LFTMVNQSNKNKTELFFCF